jgi:hypothetical protein
MEIAITVALLVVASSMIAYYQRLQDLDFGFDSKRLVTLGMTVPDGVPLASVLDRIAAEPGIRAAALGSTAPLYWRRPTQRVSAGAGSDFRRAQRVAISRDYFAALGVSLRQGRLFSVNEPAEGHTVIVNEAMARSLFNSTAVVGRQVWIEGAAYDIVGIAADYVTAFNESRGPGPKFFVPLSPADARSPVVVALALGNPNAAADALQRAIHRVAPAVVITRSETYAGMLAALGQEWLLSIAPLGPLTTIGMLLCAAGIYGALAFAIARRTRELAVRVALGADARDQLMLVTMRSLRLVAAGATIGVGLTYALARLVRAFGGEGSMMDPPGAAFIVPVLMILTVAGIATILPALRARRIDPVVLLRTT